MSRCALMTRRAPLIRRWLCLLVCVVPLLVHAQVVRNFPASALRGEMVFGAPPAATLDGQAIQLAPGARIRDEANRLILTGQAQGLKRTVLYTTDLLGQPLLIWLLTPGETTRRWPTNAAEAQAWSFDEATQTWTQP